MDGGFGPPGGVPGPPMAPASSAPGPLGPMRPLLPPQGPPRGPQGPPPRLPGAQGTCRGQVRRRGGQMAGVRAHWVALLFLTNFIFPPWCRSGYGDTCVHPSASPRPRVWPSPWRQRAWVQAAQRQRRRVRPVTWRRQRRVWAVTWRRWRVWALPRRPRQRVCAPDAAAWRRRQLQPGGQGPVHRAARRAGPRAQGHAAQ